MKGRVEGYLDKAIMEEESSEACSDPNIGALGFLNYTKHNGRHIGACGIVEGRSQLSSGSLE